MATAEGLLGLCAFVRFSLNWLYVVISFMLEGQI